MRRPAAGYRQRRGNGLKSRRTLMADRRALMVSEEDLALLYEGVRLVAERCRGELDGPDPMHRRAEEDVLERVVDLGSMVRTYMETAKPVVYECLQCGGRDGRHNGLCAH